MVLTFMTRHHRRDIVGTCLVLSVALAGQSQAATTTRQTEAPDASQIDAPPSENLPSGPVNRGFGDGMKPPPHHLVIDASAGSGIPVPNGGAAAAAGGFFAPPVAWPIIPIHVVLLQDGRVMSFGTDQNGNQGAQLVYDVWNPALGTGTNAHTVLPNTTSTDIFCASQSLIVSTGQVLINGGSLTIDGVRNYSNKITTMFNPYRNKMSTAASQMAYPRWYSSLLALPSGADLIAFGGRSNDSAMEDLDNAIPVTTPEEFNATTGWRTLTGADSTAAFNRWYYPRVAVAPGGNVFLVTVDGTMFSIDASASGSTTKLPGKIASGTDDLPSVSYAPGKMLSLRNDDVVALIDYTGSTPVATTTDTIDAVRHWANATVMADGKVLVTGGSAVANMNTGVDYLSETWDPSTGHWTAGASATIPRLYHSNSLLLADGSILTGGGGAPGPQTNLNVEIYYPPYLYANDGSGNPAARPILNSVPKLAYLGSQITGTVGTSAISRVTLIRNGSSTHSYNSDQRFLDLAFTQAGNTITATLPGDPSIAVPGYYMMFAFNGLGVPSLARIVKVVQQSSTPALH